VQAWDVGARLVVGSDFRGASLVWWREHGPTGRARAIARARGRTEIWSRGCRWCRTPAHTWPLGAAPADRVGPGKIMVT
jgi:hypothetical protein